MKGVVLLSGGIDSATVLGMTVDDKRIFDEIICIHFTYGQRTSVKEKENAEKLAGEYGKELYQIELPQLGGGVTQDKDYSDEGIQDEFGQSTGYVPFRNLTLLTEAARKAEGLWSDELIYLFIGAQGGDEDAYPDCRPEFIRKVEKVLNASTDKNEFVVHSHILHMSKREVLEIADKLDVPLEHTYSCYKRDGPCGECSACLEREEAFEKYGLKDPIYNNGE